MKNISVLKPLSCAVLVAALLAAGGAQAQTPPQAVRLKEIKDLDRLDPNWIMGLCNLPGLECNKVEVPRLFERKTDSGSEYYALMVNKTISRLAMKAPGQWQLLNRWSFETYPLPPAEDGSKARMLDIHPALYPAGPGLWAVAVLDTKTESYSGGGAQFVTADFVTLDPEATDVGEAQRQFGDVPFSCSKMVRACFTEKEYKTSPHCHGESSGYLTLKFATSSASRRYDWTATWHETSWPGGVAQSAQKTTRKTLALKPGSKADAMDAFAFCDGGPADP
jgi:hypothetical protein